MLPRMRVRGGLAAGFEGEAAEGEGGGALGGGEEPLDLSALCSYLANFTGWHLIGVYEAHVGFLACLAVVSEREYGDTPAGPGLKASGRPLHASEGPPRPLPNRLPEAT